MNQPDSQEFFTNIKNKEQDKNVFYTTYVAASESKDVEIFVQTLDDEVELPAYANLNDAGMDVRSNQDVTIAPGETVCVKTGLKFAIPPGYEIQVRPRSGISMKTPLQISNSPGTVDTGYRGELGILITNTSDEDENLFKILNLSEKNNTKGFYQIQKGDRIAQIVLAKVPRMKFTKVTDVSVIGEDRGGGFGSSGSR